VGSQRQRAASALGGIRTFPIITLLGALVHCWHNSSAAGL
jgi:hypothetical protein